MSRNLLWLVLATVLWIVWCILVVLELVPRIQRHITMWPWLMAYALCLTPVIVVALLAVIRARRAQGV